MTKINFAAKSISEHKKKGGKLAITSKFKLKDRNDLSIAYTPGVAAVCMEISKKEELANVLTLKKNTVAVISDGSAVLGLGNIGAKAAIPVMEGKAVLMKHFADVDAFPICLNTQDTEEIIKSIKLISPVFGGINLEDISSPKCFEIEERLKKELDIPVMHDDQWGAAVVTLSALINSLKVSRKNADNLVCVVSGVGAAGIATIKLIHTYNPKIKIYALDSKGIIEKDRNDLNQEKIKLINEGIISTNKSGGLHEAIYSADVFIGLSKPGILTEELVKKMNTKPIIFALANPTPEIMPDRAKKAGAFIVATGRSDFPNQINNSVFFPGFWRGMLDRRNKTGKSSYEISDLVKIAVMIAKNIKPNVEKILPSTLDKSIHKKISSFISKI